MLPTKAGSHLRTGPRRGRRRHCLCRRRRGPARQAGDLSESPAHARLASLRGRAEVAGVGVGSCISSSSKSQPKLRLLQGALRGFAEGGWLSARELSRGMPISHPSTVTSHAPLSAARDPNLKCELGLGHRGPVQPSASTRWPAPWLPRAHGAGGGCGRSGGRAGRSCPAGQAGPLYPDTGRSTGRGRIWKEVHVFLREVYLQIDVRGMFSFLNLSQRLDFRRPPTHWLL